MPNGAFDINDKIIFTDDLGEFDRQKMSGYILHSLCLDGRMEFHFNGKRFIFEQGDLLIMRKTFLMERVGVSEDFKAISVLIDAGFVEYCSPQSNYGIKGQLALFLNPVMKLSECQFELCKKDFSDVKYRINNRCFVFYDEGVRCAVQTMILDFFNFHARLNGENTVSLQHASIMNRFLDMLEAQTYRKVREVSYYASELCIAPKYLSEICKKASGHSANFWINRYTILDISRLLRQKGMTFVEISDLFNFSSPAYFSRYVQRYLGISPSDYRD